MSNNNERERNILGEEEDQIGREPIRWRRRIKEKEKQKGGRVREGERKKRWREKKKKKKKKGTTLPFAISGESNIKTCRGKRQSWSTQQELRMGT